MAKSSSSSNKAFFLAVLMAVSVPSAALAWEEGSPDSILTVSVDMGSDDAGDGSGDGDGGSSCTGFATMELSSTALSSRPDVVQPGIANPSIQQRLAALATSAIEEKVVSINDTLDGARVFTRSQSVSGSWEIKSDWITRSTENRALAGELAQQNLSQFDGEYTVSFSAQTPSLAMIDRRTYVTSPFSLSYDATTCDSDGDARAEIRVIRTDVQARGFVNNASTWLSVELPEVYTGCCSEEDYRNYLASLYERFNVSSLMEVAADGGFKGEAYLLKSSTRSDGDRRLETIASVPNDYSDDSDDIELYGSEGTATLRAVTKLYGELSQNAQLRTQYGFWMEVFPYGN